MKKNKVKFLSLIFAIGALMWIFAFSKFTIYTKIDNDKNLAEDKNLPSVQQVFSAIAGTNGNLLDAGVRINDVSRETPKTVKIYFKNLFSFDSFSLYFYGNLHSVISALAEDFSVYYYGKDGKKIKIDEVKGNTEPLYKFVSSEKIQTDTIEIVFIKAFQDDSVWFKDLKFFEKKSVGFSEWLKYSWEEKRWGLGSYWFHYFIFFILLLIPGYTFLSFFEKRRNLSFSEDRKIIFSPVFSLILMFLMSVIYVISGEKIFLFVIFAVLFLSIIFFFKNKLYKNFLKEKMVLIAMLVPLFIFFLVIARRDFFFNLPHIEKYFSTLSYLPQDGYVGYFGDNLFPWRIARVYFNRFPLEGEVAKKLLEGTAIFERTPAIPLIITNVMNVFGEAHFAYQRFMEVLVVLFYGAFYVLIKKVFSPKIALVSWLLMLLNVPLSFLAFSAEHFSKYFAVYPVVLSLLIVLTDKNRNKWLVGLLMGLAFLIHPHTLIYSMALILFYLIKHRISLVFVKNVFPLMSIVLLLVSGWFLIPKITGIDRISQKKGSFYFQEISNLKTNLLASKIVNGAALFIPNILLKNPFGGEAKISPFSDTYKFEFLHYSIIANLTPFFFLALLYYGIKKWRDKWEVLFLGTAPLAIYWFFYLHEFNYYFHYGAVYFLLFILVVPLLLAWLAEKMLKQKRIIKMFLFGSYIVFMAIDLYYLSGIFVNTKIASVSVKILFDMALLIFVSMSVLVLKMTLNNTDRLDQLRK